MCLAFLPGKRGTLVTVIESILQSPNKQCCEPGLRLASGLGVAFLDGLISISQDCARRPTSGPLCISWGPLRAHTHESLSRTCCPQQMAPSHSLGIRRFSWLGTQEGHELCRSLRTLRRRTEQEGGWLPTSEPLPQMLDGLQPTAWPLCRTETAPVGGRLTRRPVGQKAMALSR